MDSPGVFLRIALALTLVLGLAFPAGASAQVVLTFAAKRAESTIGIPHSYLRITGTTESGEAIQRTFGFMPREGSAFMVLGDRVQGAVIDEPEAKIEWERVRPFVSVQIPDATLDAVILRFKHWNENENGGYDAYSQNCIAFLADVAGTIGLSVPPGSHLSPSGFLDSLADMNPPGSFPGLQETPVPNPTQPDLIAAEPEVSTPPASEQDAPSPKNTPVDPEPPAPD